MENTSVFELVKYKRIKTVLIQPYTTFPHTHDNNTQIKEQFLKSLFFFFAFIFSFNFLCIILFSILFASVLPFGIATFKTSFYGEVLIEPVLTP